MGNAEFIPSSVSLIVVAMTMMRTFLSFMLTYVCMYIYIYICIHKHVSELWVRGSRASSLFWLRLLPQGFWAWCSGVRAEATCQILTPGTQRVHIYYL